MMLVFFSIIGGCFYRLFIKAPAPVKSSISANPIPANQKAAELNA